jgi:hypothetical protein
MSKDPFQILADELTLIRHDMDRLRRTSLDKAEAEALHGVVADALEKMHNMAIQAPQGVRAAIADDRAQMSRNASQAATEAAQGAVEGLKQHLDAERSRFAQAAGEARREAWRWFGGFWVWLASIGATGALLGALAALWLTGRDDAREFGRFPRIYCQDAGGTIVANADGRRFCGVWIDPPGEAGS